jgi:Leucine-rich repeat (LRR) protein
LERIDSIEQISDALEVINLADNLIKSIDPLRCLHSLREVNLANNAM